MPKIKFKNAALKFITEISNKAGDDLIYSLALENGNVFLCVAASPTLTNKRFDTGNERILFWIKEDEHDMEQEKLIEHLVNQINDHIIIEEPDNENN